MSIEFYDDACSTQTPKPCSAQIPKQGGIMRTTEWEVSEGSAISPYDNYSKGREAYLKLVKKHKLLRASKNVFTRLKARMVQFVPVN